MQGIYAIGSVSGGGGIPTTGTPFKALQYDSLGVAQEVSRIVSGSDGNNSVSFDDRQLFDSSPASVIDYSDGAALSDIRQTEYRRTITPAGTTGNQTIDKIAGTVNIAAGGSSVVVTNSFVNVTSIIFVVLRSSDTTASIRSVVAAAGSFTIRIVACTAEVSIGFVVTN